MASLPRKGITGDNLKKWVVETVNGLIDYLHSHRVRPGNGIRVDETPSGVVVSLADRPAPSVVQISGGTSGGGSAVIGFPDYFSQNQTPIYQNTSYPVSSDSWLIGYVGVAENAYQGGSATLGITDNVSLTTVSLDLFYFYNRNSGAVSMGTSVGFQIPIPANSTIYITATDSALVTASLYPCI